MDKNIETLQHWIDESSNIVFFGGAGVSTESGIPDFRSTDGLYFQKYDYPPETILSHTFLKKRSFEFYKFYRDKMLNLWAKPNAAHKKLAELETAGKLKAIVTQNIDGLHQEAGSREVLELHGSVLRNYCENCGAQYSVDFIANGTGTPTCEKCGGSVRPDVVLYEEGLNTEVLKQAIHYLQNADVLIIGGTSLVVYPAAGLINYYHGKKMVLINKTPLAFDSRADLVINAPIGEVFNQIQVRP